jgi:hypothetical protein
MMQSCVEAGVVGCVNQYQVFRAIVRAVEVAMVNVFIRVQRAAQHIGHDLAMLGNVTTLIGHRMLREPQQYVAVMFGASTLPTGLVRTLHGPTFAGLAYQGFGCAGARTENTRTNGAWLALDRSAAGIAGVCTFHTVSIPQMATYRNMEVI